MTVKHNGANEIVLSEAAGGAGYSASASSSCWMRIPNPCGFADDIEALYSLSTE